MILFSKCVCVLFSGKAGVGKTTCANFLKKIAESENLTVELSNFAKGVKQTARFMGWDGEKDSRGRQLLIDVGMAGRKYNPEIWAKQLLVNSSYNDALRPADMLIVDDWRFPNEGKYLIQSSNFSVFKVRVEAPEREILLGLPQYHDESETSLPSFFDTPDFYDIGIVNVSSLNDLESHVKILFNYIVECTSVLKGEQNGF